MAKANGKEEGKNRPESIFTEKPAENFFHRTERAAGADLHLSQGEVKTHPGGLMWEEGKLLEKFPYKYYELSLFQYFDPTHTHKTSPYSEANAWRLHVNANAIYSTYFRLLSAEGFFSLIKYSRAADVLFASNGKLQILLIRLFGFSLFFFQKQSLI